MATTIEVKRETWRLLERLKRELGAKSFDEALREVLRERLGVPGSMFGIDRGKVSRFEEGDRAEDRE
jgi:predicted CopG family antitoxin